MMCVYVTTKEGENHSIVPVIKCLKNMACYHRSIPVVTFLGQEDGSLRPFHRVATVG